LLSAIERDADERSISERDAEYVTGLVAAII
jgi:hypothetical protein